MRVMAIEFGWIWVGINARKLGLSRREEGDVRCKIGSNVT